MDWRWLLQNSAASLCLCRFAFLLKDNVDTSRPKLVQTTGENEGAELHITSISSFFLCSGAFVYLFVWKLRKLSSIISFLTDPTDCRGRAFSYIFNHLMLLYMLQEVPCGPIWRGSVMYSDDEDYGGRKNRDFSLSWHTHIHKLSPF